MALDYFDFDVAVEDNLVLVDAHYHDSDSDENIGMTYTFSKLNGRWQETEQLLPIDAVHIFERQTQFDLISFWRVGP